MVKLRYKHYIFERIYCYCRDMSDKSSFVSFINYKANFKVS